jgi:hypothetical protein
MIIILYRCALKYNSSNYYFYPIIFQILKDLHVYIYVNVYIYTYANIYFFCFYNIIYN